MFLIFVLNLYFLFYYELNQDILQLDRYIIDSTTYLIDHLAYI